MNKSAPVTQGFVSVALPLQSGPHVPAQVRLRVALPGSQAALHDDHDPHDDHAIGLPTLHATRLLLAPAHRGPQVPVQLRVRVKLPAPHVVLQLVLMAHDDHEYGVPAMRGRMR